MPSTASSPPEPTVTVTTASEVSGAPFRVPVTVTVVTFESSLTDVSSTVRAISFEAVSSSVTVTDTSAAVTPFEA